MKKLLAIITLVLLASIIATPFASAITQAPWNPAWAYPKLSNEPVFTSGQVSVYVNSFVTQNNWVGLPVVYNQKMCVYYTGNSAIYFKQLFDDKNREATQYNVGVGGTAMTAVVARLNPWTAIAVGLVVALNYYELDQQTRVVDRCTSPTQGIAIVYEEISSVSSGYSGNLIMTAYNWVSGQWELVGYTSGYMYPSMTNLGSIYGYNQWQTFYGN